MKSTGQKAPGSDYNKASPRTVLILAGPHPRLWVSPQLSECARSCASGDSSLGAGTRTPVHLLHFAGQCFSLWDDVGGSWRATCFRLGTAGLRAAFHFSACGSVTATDESKMLFGRPTARRGHGHCCLLVIHYYLARFLLPPFPEVHKPTRQPFYQQNSTVVCLRTHGS